VRKYTTVFALVRQISDTVQLGTKIVGAFNQAPVCFCQLALFSGRQHWFKGRQFVAYH